MAQVKPYDMCFGNIAINELWCDEEDWAACLKEVVDAKVCGDNYVAVVGGCNVGESGEGVCSKWSGDSCPHKCVPRDSIHTEDGSYSNQNKNDYELGKFMSSSEASFTKGSSCISTLEAYAKAVEKAITKRTKAIVPVHMRGAPAQMDAIMDVANKYGIPVIEDVAQAAGGSFKSKMLGSIGKIGCFSFDYYKIIVSGEGGFYTTNDERLYTRALNWHDCAACWRPDRFGPEKENEDLFCGENYRMSELEGAVALAQIRKAKDIVAKYRASKNKIKNAIEKFPGLGFRKLADQAGDTGICLIIFLPNAETTKKVLPALKAEGVPCGGIYDSKVRDWHTYNYWEHILQYKSVSQDRLPWSGLPKNELPKYTKDMCPKSLDLLSKAILIDIDYNFGDEDCNKISTAINKVLSVYLK